MLLLDVVYNHFGPEGAYYGAIAPQFFTDRHHTPWGAALNMDGDGSPTVREFFIHNALYWLEEFHLDGLRLDAVHAIRDDSPRHFLRELAERVRAAFPERHIHLILENDENEASLLRRDPDGRPGRYTAQWNDDVHHALHVAATGESAGYYADYLGDTERLGRALAEGFAFQGEVMPYRGRNRGEASARLPPTAFVAFAQNHDQIGNRAFGERLAALAPQAARARGGGGLPALAADPDAVHGRGMGRLAALPVLLRLRAGSRGGGAARASSGVLALSRIPRPRPARTDPRPDGGGNLSRRQARLERPGARNRMPPACNGIATS